MRLHRLNLVLLTLLLIIGVASSSYADISNAAVLFLRIAPGSRSAGMGEAFVAVADDATATHWNPAGLGKYPLAHTWIDAGIPEEHGPMLGIAALKSRGGSNYLAYDVWGISEKGLVRFDHKKWHTEEERKAARHAAQQRYRNRNRKRLRREARLAAVTRYQRDPAAARARLKDYRVALASTTAARRSHAAVAFTRWSCDIAASRSTSFMSRPNPFAARRP